jgi:ribosomal protein S18 acetylase RimI-like enzyme
MPIPVKRLASPSIENLATLLGELKTRKQEYAHGGEWTEEELAQLPEQIQAFGAYDSEGTLGLLLFCPGFLEPWGAPTDLLGANPILPPGQDAADIHTALLLEARAWAAEEDLTGLEILLPMGPANMHLDETQDAFYAGLGFERSYYTMTRELDALDPCSETGHTIEVVPAAAMAMSALYENYAACVAHGEIELVSRQSEGERREYFDSLTEETLGHPGSLALLEGDRLLGFTLAAGVSEAAAHLAWIGILPDHRGEGLGRHLLCNVMATCRERQIDTMSLYTDASVGAQTPYQALGFIPAGALTYRWRRTSRHR